MSIEKTREIMTRYFEGNYEDTLAGDVVFTDMTTGAEFHTPLGITEMMHWFYNIAFEATTADLNIIFGEGKAALECKVVGRHIGEYAGLAATGKEFRVPLCVFYDLEKDRIKRARIHFNLSVLKDQIGA
jgi:hypothetical protein